MHTKSTALLRAFPAAGLLAILAVVLAALPLPSARADEGWVITSFEAAYTINEDGTVTAVEDIRVDFGGLEKHGIFRDIPVEYEYDKESNRLIRLTGITVDDGEQPHQFEVLSNGINTRIKIGDPDVLISGPQRYRIRYTINRGLNPFPDHDEFYWNITGNEWPVDIENASAFVFFPDAHPTQIACYQGPVGSDAPCSSDTLADGSPYFAANGTLAEGSGLTVVVGLPKGAVAVGPPELVDANKTIGEQVSDFLGLSPIPIIASLVLLVAAVVAVIRQWWVAGRDRWYGDMFHVADKSKSDIKPLGAHESIVTEFTPPEVDGAVPRRLRPAEIGLLVDEKADTLDVTASIVDLAVQKHLVIKETEEGGVFGLFKKKDYELEKLDTPETGLLPYEKKLLDSLFDDGSPVKLSDLKNKFYKDLAKVKEQLYSEVTKELKFFPRNPDTTRTVYQVAGGATLGVGGLGVFGLGALGAGIVGVPVIVAGVLLLILSPSMPRRSADGRVMYRRCLGFRHYIETAETSRQEFAEKANLFQEYLPYAIVFGCVGKWAKAFEGLDDEVTQPGWYYGTHPFVAAAFVSSVSDFSESISSVMASTPGGSGSSGFGGGGSSGGGGGGGGGGSW